MLLNMLRMENLALNSLHLIICCSVTHGRVMIFVALNRCMVVNLLFINVDCWKYNTIF